MNFFASLSYMMALALHRNFLTGIRNCSGLRSRATILHEVSATMLKDNVRNDLIISALVPTAQYSYAEQTLFSFQSSEFQSELKLEVRRSPLCASMAMDFTT